MQAVRRLFVHEMIRASVGVLLLRALGIGFSFLSTMLLARMLGARGLGVFSAAVAVTTLLTIPCTLGLPIGLMKFLPQYLATGEVAKARGVLSWSQRTPGALALAAALLMTAGVVTFAPTRETTVAFLLASASLPACVLLEMNSAALRGLHYAVQGQAIEVIVRQGGFLVFAAVAFMVVEDISASHGIAMYVASVWLGCLVAWILLRRCVPLALRTGAKVYTAREWVFVSLPMLVTVAASLVMNQADLLMIASLHSAREAGIYRIAATGAGTVLMIAGSAATTLAPRFSALASADQWHELRMLVGHAGRPIFIGTLAVAVILAVSAEPLLVIAFGVEFTASAWPMRFLLLAHVLNAATGPAGILLLVTGHERAVSRCSLAAAALNVVLNGMFIPFFGAAGGAAATAISQSWWSLSLWAQARRSLGFSTVVTVSRGS